MQEIYSILSEFSDEEKKQFLTSLPPKQKLFLDAILEQIQNNKYPNFGYYVQRIKNISPSAPNYRKEYQAMFGIKRSLMNKLKEWKLKHEMAADLPPDISEAWRSYLWARYLYEKMEWDAAMMWVKKTLFNAKKENEILLWFQAKILYYFLIDIEADPPKLKDITEDYEALQKGFIINAAAWLMNVYNPVAYTQEKSKKKLFKIAEELKQLSEVWDLSPENKKWLDFLKDIIFYYDNVFGETIDAKSTEVLNRTYNFLMHEENYKLFPVPSKIVRFMLWDLLITFKYVEGFVEEVLQESKKMLNEISEKHPYYERVATHHLVGLLSNAKFEELKNFSKKLIEQEMVKEHSEYHYYVALLFLGNWTKEEEKEIISFINRDKVFYSSYGRQLRLRNQALFFFFQQDLEGLEVVIKTYRNSSYKDKKWNALYDFCYVLYLTTKLIVSPPKNTETKVNKIKELIKKYSQFPLSAKWIRNHHALFLKNKVLPIIEKYEKK